MWLAGAPRDCIVPFYEATVPHSYIGWGKTTHLGFGIPLMIGAKMACPDKMCVNLMGDGAFGMSGTDVETSARSVSATPFRRTIWLVSGILCVAHLFCVAGLRDHDRARQQLRHGTPAPKASSHFKD